MPNARIICLALALVFFLCAAFDLPRWTKLDGERVTARVSWRDLAYAFVVLSFLV